ncbi:hypothetical protein [Acinetobacter sp.]|uniref:hypothetical protein n=1 Tax=Acinetobacter sp. TaxID=472 RepID=UPI00388EE3A0
MSFLFTLEEDKLADQLPKIFENYENHVKNAEPLFDLEGMRLELIARNLPNHQMFYAHRANEMKQVMKWLENYKSKLEARYTKNYAQGQRALSARDITTFIGGEKEIVELNQLIIEATLIYSQLDEIVEAFKQMGWMLGHVTKLRVAELQDVEL